MINLAIFSPNENATSETFIQAHKKLPFNIKYYYNGLLPNSLEGQGPLLKSRITNRLRNKLNSKFTSYERALIKSLKKEKVDCVLAEYGITACHTLKVVKHLNLPLIVHFFGFEASHHDTIEKYKEDYNHVFKYAARIIVVSRKMIEDVKKLGCSSEKIVLSYCGPNETFFDVKPHYLSSQFLSIGRFVEKKAPYLTISAFHKVVEKHPEARLALVGDGLLLNVCKNLVKLWKLEKSVDFLGIRNPEEIGELFEKSIALVQHSIITENGDSEGTPVVVLDAQAAGLPVISTFHAGISDVIINEETGLLVEEHDVEGMAKNMMRLLQEKGLTQRLGNAGRKRIRENFSLEIHLNTLKEIIENTCAER